MSQPRSWMLRRIMPGTCAPSTAERIPLRAGQGGDFFGRQHDAGHGRDVAEEDDARARRDGVVEKIQDLRRRLSPGAGSVIFFTTMP